jgi:(p)ppGpp synthase/HD superfamily hydrolase
MSNSIKEHNINITRAQIGTTKDHRAVCIFSVSISDLSQLGKMISSLEGINGVIQVERVQKKNA